MNKVDYVKSQKQDRFHTCHWLGCKKQCPPAMWGCSTHWFKLPKHLRDRVWAAYRPGQEKDMRPSDSYLKVSDEIDLWIREQTS